MSGNPWIRSIETETTSTREEATVEPVYEPERRVAPQAGLVPPTRDGSLGRRTVHDADEVSVWWLGAHGGAGETTLEELLPHSRAADHQWPLVREDALRPALVVLVARTSMRGLRAAQAAATEWAAGNVAVELSGLVLIADAPGRLPKPLRDFAAVVGGGVPTVWRVPWIESWRTLEAVSPEAAPSEVRRLLDDVRTISATRQPIR